MHSRLKVALLFAIMLLLVPAAHAADRVLTVYPAGLLQNTFTAEYEWATAYDSTYAVHLSAARVTSSEEEASSLAGGFSVRKYVLDESKALEGFYLGGGITLSAGNSKNKATSEESSTFAVGIAGRAGYKQQVADAFIVDIGVSVGTPLFVSSSADGDSSTAFGIGTLATAVTVGLGFAF